MPLEPVRLQRRSLESQAHPMGTDMPMKVCTDDTCQGQNAADHKAGRNPRCDGETSTHFSQLFDFQLSTKHSCDDLTNCEAVH